MSSLLKIGILGAARIAPKAVCDPARVVSGVTVAGLAARNKDRAQAFAAKHGVETVYPSYEALITSPEIDLVYNPLPINLHAEWSIRALEAGKHVLCEKPFAMNLDEAKAMQAAADRSGKRLITIATTLLSRPAWTGCRTAGSARSRASMQTSASRSATAMMKFASCLKQAAAQ